jgi:hypothetical protein
MMARRIGFGILFAGMVGCGDGKPAAVPVTGTVTYKKTTPPAGALVVFHAANPDLEKAIQGKPVGRVDDDGKFRLSTYAEGDGAPPGDYGVTIDWRKAGKEPKFAFGDAGSGAGRPVLDPKFSNPSAPLLKATVTANGPNDFHFEVE